MGGNPIRRARPTAQAEATMTTRVSIRSEFGNRPDLRPARYVLVGGAGLAGLPSRGLLGGAGEPGCNGIQGGGSLAGKDSTPASSTGSTVSCSGTTPSTGACPAGSSGFRCALMRYSGRWARTQAMMPAAFIAPAVSATGWPRANSIVVGMLRI